MSPEKKMTTREYVKDIAKRIDDVEWMLYKLDLSSINERMREYELEDCPCCKLRLRSDDIDHDRDACVACVEELGVASCRYCKREHLADEEHAEKHYGDCEELCIECHEEPLVERSEFYLCRGCLEKLRVRRLTTDAQLRALERFCKEGVR